MAGVKVGCGTSSLAAQARPLALAALWSVNGQMAVSFGSCFLQKGSRQLLGQGPPTSSRCQPPTCRCVLAPRTCRIEFNAQPNRSQRS
ncbi:hypothetical protein TREES_T100018727 [Tupaia chinensis]|uniref:Uncharacterized protein n=1 Tax=Tupaia chinensis TaxID=246437 RepID=L9KJ57_TUPCH|nr:hypothetical protein TREES_T100018727 [Tupaia chinensis]